MSDGSTSGFHAKGQVGGECAMANMTDEAIIARAMELLEAALERGEAFTSPAMIGKFLTAKMRRYDREVFAVVLLDTRHRLLAYRELHAGSVDGSQVSPREVARAALLANAAAAVIAHNHPSGSREFSAADKAVTYRIREALELVDVRLLDHFVIGDGPAVSMAVAGLI